MENESSSNNGLLSHFSGLIRLVIFIILIAIITFFTVRFIKNRQATNKAKQAASTSQQKSANTTSSSATDKSESSSSSSNNNTSDSGVTPLPTGVADSNATGSSSTANTSNASTTKVPQAGMGEDMLFTSLLISFIVFLLAKNRQSKRALNELLQACSET